MGISLKLIHEGGTHTEQGLHNLKMDFPTHKTALQAVLTLLLLQRENCWYSTEEALKVSQ